MTEQIGAIIPPTQFRPIEELNLPRESIESLESKNIGSLMSDAEMREYLESDSTPRVVKTNLEQVADMLMHKSAIRPIPGGEEDIYTGGLFKELTDPRSVSAVRTVILQGMRRKGAMTDEYRDEPSPKLKEHTLVIEAGKHRYEDAKSFSSLEKQWLDQEPEVSLHEGGGIHRLRRVVENPYGAKLTETDSYDTNGKLYDIEMVYEQKDRHADMYSR